MFKLKWLVGLLAVGLACAAGAEDVLVLTADNFEQATKDHSFLVVEFFAPWCGHCKSLAPEWEEAAKKLKGDMSAGQAITLATVDATVERSLAEKYEVRGFPTIKIFEGSVSNPSNYEGPREAEGIVTFLKMRAGPASKELKSADELETIKKENPVIMLNAGLEIETWIKLANSMRDHVFWCHTTDKAVIKALGVKSDSITMIHEGGDYEEKAVVYSGDAKDMDKLKEFVAFNRTPVALLIKKGDQAALKMVFEDENKPNVFLFTTELDAGLTSFKPAVMGVRGKMVSARFQNSGFIEAFKHFGLDKFAQDDALPKVLIEDRSNGLRFLMAGEITEKSVTQFIADFKDNKLEPFLRSEPEPADNTGPVKVIVGTTFDSKVRNAGHFVFLEAYAPWCGHCKKLTPIWDDLGLAFSESEGKSKVVIAKIDATTNDLPKAIGVQGFPTLLFFKGDGTAPQNYEGGRDFKSLAAFVSKETGATVKAGFKPSQVQKPDPPIDKLIIDFFQTDFQIPLMEDGTTVSGLWLTAAVIFLLFIASISLVIACISPGAPSPTAAPTAAPARKAPTEASDKESRKQK